MSVLQERFIFSPAVKRGGFPHCNIVFAYNDMKLDMTVDQFDDKTSVHKFGDEGRGGVTHNRG